MGIRLAALLAMLNILGTPLQGFLRVVVLRRTFPALGRHRQLPTAPNRDARRVQSGLVLVFASIAEQVRRERPAKT